MKKKIHKLFWAWEFEKEEKWLNDMAAKGLLLTYAGVFTYVFEDGEPGKYQYRLELLENAPKHFESQKYIEFMEETGAEHIGTVMRWVYFRKKASDAPFEIFSDISSRIEHMKRLQNLLTCLVVAELLIGTSNLMMGIVNHMAVNVGCAIPLFILGIVFILQLTNF